MINILINHKVIFVKRKRWTWSAEGAKSHDGCRGVGVGQVEEGAVRPLLKSWSTAVGLAVCVSLFGTVLAAQAPDGSANTANAAKSAKDKEETCRVSGMVVKMADGAPLKSATVRLENDSDHEHIIAAKTTADGRFELRNVPSGRYKLKVTRNGYVENEYGQQKQSDPGATFALSPGQDKQVLFKLIPAAVIAGKVFDQDGEAVPRAVVVASREVYREGHRTLTSSGFAQTDDLGQYRLFGLAPGRYYVSAVQRDWDQVTGDREFTAPSADVGERGYVKTYYPGTPELGRASLIVVKEGEEIAGTDIPLKQVAVYRIRGKVLNALTHKGGSEAYLILISRTKRLEWDFGGGEQVHKSDGSFEFPNVVPGAYLLVAYWSDQGKTYSTQQKIDIAESDLDGVSLVIGAGATIPGNIRWEGLPSLDRDELSVSVQSADMSLTWRDSSRVEANQQFTVKDVGEGDYQVSVNGLSKDCYIKDTVYGEMHSADGLISVSKGGGEHLEIVVSSRGARVQGAVVDKDGLPATGVWVVAVPEEGRRTNFRLFKEQTTDQYGKFDLHGLAPGSYKLFSWTGIERGEWEDEEFLKPFEVKGESVELQDEDVKTVNLGVIERKNTGNQ
jgi:protocatechuate 3,4-dioxygenase beta subunit